jgi:hypothetical protein
LAAETCSAIDSNIRSSLVNLSSMAATMSTAEGAKSRFHTCVHEIRGVSEELPPKQLEIPGWLSTETPLLSSESIADLLANRIPDVHLPHFITPAECDKLISVIETHEIVSEICSFFRAGQR